MFIGKFRFLQSEALKVDFEEVSDGASSYFRTYDFLDPGLDAETVDEAELTNVETIEVDELFEFL